MNVYEKVCEIISDILSLEDDFSFSEEMTFSELSLDSLDVVDIIMEIESSFDIEITDEELEDIKNLGELTKLISEKEGT